MAEIKELVTKQTLKQWIEKDAVKTVGRALVALFKRQEVDEREENHTNYKNGVGFSANDARIGSLGAKYYMKHKRLEEWQLKPWIKEVNGFPRLCKYAKQLNEIANENKKQNN